MVALPDKGNASERWRRKATGLYRAAGLPEEASYAPPLFHDCSCRGLRRVAHIWRDLAERSATG